jgi:hypothetical protein
VVPSGTRPQCPAHQHTPVWHGTSAATHGQRSDLHPAEQWHLPVFALPQAMTPPALAVAGVTLCVREQLVSACALSHTMRPHATHTLSDALAPSIHRQHVMPCPSVVRRCAVPVPAPLTPPQALLHLQSSQHATPCTTHEHCLVHAPLHSQAPVRRTPSLPTDPSPLPSSAAAPAPVPVPVPLWLGGSAIPVCRFGLGLPVAEVGASGRLRV